MGFSLKGLGGSLALGGLSGLGVGTSQVGSVLSGGGGGKKQQPPAPPDYVGAAREQGVANKEAALQTGMVSNPNINTPLGSRTVTWNQTGNGFATPTINETLSPSGQARFDQEQRIVSSLGDTAENSLGRVGETFSQPFSFGGADDLQSQAEQAYLSRMEPQFQRDEDALRTRLAVQGIDPYGEAANREHERLGFQKNDARTQAILKAFQMRPQMLQEDLAIRNVPLNELNALRTGSQVSLPQFQPFTGSTVQPAPTFAATQAQGQAGLDAYNTQAMQQAMFQQGLFGLGGAGLMAFSDRRLKSNIERVGTHHGIGVYEYDTFGRREIGVMADEVLEVKPEAVIEHPSGFLMVNYACL